MILVERRGRFLPIFDAFAQRLNECFDECVGERFEFLFDRFMAENEPGERRADVTCGAFRIRGEVSNALKGIEKVSEGDH